MDAGNSDATQLLERLARGDREAGERLVGLLYGSLRDIAERLMRDQSADHTLQPTALVSEAWIRIQGSAQGKDWEGHRHFLRVAARAMRSVLVDHARARRADKRGGPDAVRLPLDAVLLEAEDRVHDLLAFDGALSGLAELDPELAQVVELRFYGGLSNAELARVLDVSVPTVERRWRTARVWLRSALREHDVE